MSTAKTFDEIFNKIINFQVLTLTMVFSGSQDRAYLIFLLLNGFSLVFLELGLEVAAAHFDAQLSSVENTDFEGILNVILFSLMSISALRPMCTSC